MDGGVLSSSGPRRVKGAGDGDVEVLSSFESRSMYRLQYGQ